MKTCKRCLIEKSLDDFSDSKQNGNIYKKANCKECRNIIEKEHRDKIDINTKREKYKKVYKQQLERIKIDKEYDIRKWATIWKARPKENPYRLVQQKFLDSRKDIPLEELIRLAKIAYEKFPYMQFAYKTKLKLYTASVDRIDSNKPYTLDNIKVVPFWLNSAKLNGTFDELLGLIEQLNPEVKKYLLE